jgi:hypothetical protein
MTDIPNPRISRSQSPSTGGGSAAPPPSPPPPPPPEVPERKERTRFLRQGLPLLVLTMAIVGLVVLGWIAYKEGQGTDEGEVPLIKAEAGPFKVKPKDPGGMEISNTDKGVYDIISNTDVPDEEAALQIERVVPMPEEPMAREEMNPLYEPEDTPLYQFEGVGSVEQEGVPQIVMPGEEGQVPAVDLVPEDVSPSPEQHAEAMPDFATEAPKVVLPEEDEVAAITQDNKESDKYVPIPRRAPMSVKKIELEEAVEEAPKEVKTTKQPEKKTSKEVEKKIAALPIPKSMQYKQKREAKKHTASVNSGGYKVQLGSYRSESQAKDGWKMLSRKFSRDLRTLDYNVEKANLGAKGVFYRLQAGPLSSDSKARSICKTLIAQKQGCIVVNVH